MKQETIYALPEPLIEAILSEIPDFFNEKEIQFERDLTRLAGAGFFMKRPFDYQPLPSPSVPPGDARNRKKLDEQFAKSVANIRKMLEGEMLKNGNNEEEVREFWSDEEEWLKKINQHKWGYAGWLVMNATFHSECDRFQREWGSNIKELGGFPTLPISYMGEFPEYPEEQHRPFYEAYMSFYLKWGIHSFATWDLPIPMSPDSVHPSFYDLRDVHRGGILQFLPWYLTKVKDLKFRELVKHMLTSRPPLHLEDWFKGNKKYWGYKRLAVMLELYIYLELCLKSRYGSRLKGHVGNLDYAFSNFFSDDSSMLYDASIHKVDTITKIRQEMNRRLKKEYDLKIATK